MGKEEKEFNFGQISLDLPEEKPLSSEVVTPIVVEDKKIEKKKVREKKKELLDITLSEENILREFRLPRTNKAGLVKLKLNDLAKVFRNNLTFEIDDMLKIIYKNGYLNKNANGWYSLNILLIVSIVSLFFIIKK